MQTGQLTIGTMILNETNVVQDDVDNNGVRTLSLVGRETSCEGPVDPLKSNIMGMVGKLMPVTFQYKTTYNGYYAVTGANVDYEKWYQGSTTIGWSLSLARLGPDNTVDLESRVANVVRSNAYSQTGERWHAPAGLHTTYYVGATTPAKTTRASADGPIAVYRPIPANTNPLWSCPVTGYTNGRSRFIKDGIERLSERFDTDSLGWEMNNGLVRVKPNPDNAVFTTFLIAIYDGTAWQEKAWDVRIAGDTLRPTADFKGVTVIRNDPECVILRCVAAQPNDNTSRVLVDLTLRRGSRFVEGYIQRAVAGTISVQLDTAITFNAPSGGYTIQSGPDSGTGLRAVAGSAMSFTAATNGGVSVSSNTTLDFWVGAEVPGAIVGTNTNNGFELGNTTSWTTTNGTLTVVNTPVIRGSWAGKLVADGVGQSRSDYYGTTPATPGKSYTLTGWLRADVALTNVQIAMLWNNGATFLSASTSSGALSANIWTPFSVTGTAPANTTQVGRQFAINNPTTAGTTMYADDLVIRETTASGDTAADMQQQYIGAMTEKVGVVRR